MRHVVRASALLAVVGSVTYAQPTFTLTYLGDLPGGSVGGYCFGLNDVGQVVGSSASNAGDTAFIWHPSFPNATSGTMHAIGNLPGVTRPSWPYAINNDGVVVGNLSDASGIGLPAAWIPETANGPVGAWLLLPGQGSGVADGLATGINDAGVISGELHVGGFETPAVWTPAVGSGYTLTLLPTMGAPLNSGYSYGLNSSNTLAGTCSGVGSRGVCWRKLGPSYYATELPGPGVDGTSGNARAISDTGIACGYASTPSEATAAIWTVPGSGAIGAPLSLGDLAGGDVDSQALAINDMTWVVGKGSSGTGYHGFLWTSTTGMLDLNSLLTVGAAGWVVNEAVGVNEAGQIAATGTFDPDGAGGVAPVQGAVLLTPYPMCNAVVQQQPQPQQLALGGAAQFSVTVTGDVLGYQWRRNGAALSNDARVSGATTPTLTITGMVSGDQGQYDCVMTRGLCGDLVSNAAPLSCAPILTTQPQPFVLLTPGVQLSVSVPVGATNTYRWRQNGQNLFNIPGFYSGVTTRTLSILAVDPSLEGMYDVVVTNTCGVTTSGEAQVSICDRTDFNGDGLYPDTADVDDFLSVFSGGPCSTGTCGDTDFNNDGLYPDTADIDALLSVFSGGPCWP